jgi:ribose 5-phosphate isomerase B
MKVGIATDHGGFGLKEELVAQLRGAGNHEVIDFGAHELKSDDDYPDYVPSLAKAVVSGQVTRGIAIAVAAWELRSARTRFQAFVPP